MGADFARGFPPSEEAARIKGVRAVASADCFSAALGARKKAKLVTGDPEFKKFEADVAVEWIK